MEGCESQCSQVKWAMDKSLLSLVASSSDITGTKEFLFFYHTRTYLASFICKVFFLSIRAPFVTHFGFCFFWLGLGSSLSLSIFVLPFSFCWVFCLMELARVSLFSSLLWFQKFGDLFLVFSIFFPIYTQKTQIVLFFPKTLSPQCTNSSPKNKNKKQKIK